MRLGLVVALLAGCGDPSSTGFPQSLQDARCEYYVRCGLFANTDDCNAYYDRVAIANPNTEMAVDQGKIEYDKAAAKACVDALGTLSCDSTQADGHELDVCDQVYVGTGQLGDACALDGECASDNCVRPTCTMACCTGSCGAPRMLPAVGQPCSVLCADGAFCGNDAICHAVLPAGAACETPDGCDRGLYCAGLSPTSPGTCSAIPHLGDTCDFISGCAEVGAVCVGTCLAAGLPGAACTTRAQCSQYYDCDGSHCVAYPTLGMPCATTCSDASWCDPSTMTCAAQKANGATCVYNDECATHYCSQQQCNDIPICF